MKKKNFSAFLVAAALCEVYQSPFKHAVNETTRPTSEKKLIYSYHSLYDMHNPNVF